MELVQILSMFLSILTSFIKPFLWVWNWFNPYGNPDEDFNNEELKFKD